VPLRSKSLAFLIENSSNKNGSQLADNKQKRPVLIENFEPNRARVFAPRHPPQIALTTDARRSFAAFLLGSAQHVESVVTYSKQSTGELLPGSRIARLCSFSLRVCEGGRSTGVASWNTGRGPQSRCLNSLTLHLTNFRLNRLQLFPLSGVCNERHIQEIPVRADNVRVTHSEAPFVVE
jgi:hypothetical protein